MELKAEELYLEKSWDWRNSKLIDKDIKEELKDCSGLFYGDIIHLQLIKELKQLQEIINKYKIEGKKP